MCLSVILRLENRNTGLKTAINKKKIEKKRKKITKKKSWKNTKLVKKNRAYIRFKRKSETKPTSFWC